MRRALGKLYIMVSAVLAILMFGTPACTRQSASVDADRIVTQALVAQASLVSYKVDLHVTEDVSAETNGAQMQYYSYSIDMSGAVDETNRKMKMDTTMRFEGDGINGGEFASNVQEFQEFVVGDYMYIGLSSTDDEVDWSRIELMSGFWEKAEMVGQQLELLQSAGRKLVGSEKVSGVDCYVFKVTTGFADMWSVLSQQSILGESSQFPTLKADWVKSTSLTQWIAKDTAHMTKSEMRMTFQIPAQDLDESLGNGEIDIEAAAEALFHDYNEPVSIELPAEATA